MARTKKPALSPPRTKTGEVPRKSQVVPPKPSVVQPRSPTRMWVSYWISSFANRWWWWTKLLELVPR